MYRSRFIFVIFAVVLSGFATPAPAFDVTVLDAVVRLKPDWSLQARGVGAEGAPRDPEGTGVAVLAGGYIATNAHVIGDAKNVEVMLTDGRVFASKIIGRDPLTDIALLKIEADVPLLLLAPSPDLADPVCAIGNQFGLGLSVTCGVVSALARSGIGFNQIEDFIQTDASVNPGGSGGALVDADQRLVGLVSAIFTKNSDADIGVNFATSAALLMRVVTDLRDYGTVRQGRVGLDVAAVPPALQANTGGVMVTRVDVDGAAFQAGIEAADIITKIDSLRITSRAQANAAFYMVRPDDPVSISFRRGDALRTVTLTVATP